jgi:hypothetical protein
MSPTRPALGVVVSNFVDWEFARAVYQATRLYLQVLAIRYRCFQKRPMGPRRH